jgi:Cu-Zn family superoxide dismutase
MTTDRTARRRRSLTAAALAAGVALTLVSVDHAEGHGWRARVALRDPSGRRVGVVRFEGDDAGTDVSVSLAGIAEGRDTFHGLHIHVGDASGACDGSTAPPFTNVGGHWTTGGELHGHHTGDLPPVLVQADGTGTASATTARFAPEDLVGKAVVLHAGPDNLANVPTRYVTGTPPVAGPDATTSGTGDAGSRVACGVIARD